MTIVLVLLCLQVDGARCDSRLCISCFFVCIICFGAVSYKNIPGMCDYDVLVGCDCDIVEFRPAWQAAEAAQAEREAKAESIEQRKAKRAQIEEYKKKGWCGALC